MRGCALGNRNGGEINYVRAPNPQDRLFALLLALSWSSVAQSVVAENAEWIDALDSRMWKQLIWHGAEHKLLFATGEVILRQSEDSCQVG